MASMNCLDYLREVEKNILKEEERANLFLEAETIPKLLKTIQSEIIEKQAQNLVEKDTGCDHMFAHKKLEELALMYRIYKRVDSTLKFIIHKMQIYIIKRGEEIIND
jgi:cullin 3